MANTGKFQRKRCFQDFTDDVGLQSANHSTGRPYKFLRLTEDSAPFFPATAGRGKARPASNWLWLSPEIHPLASERKSDRDCRARGGEQFLKLVPQIHPQYVAPGETGSRPVGRSPGASSPHQSKSQNDNLSHGSISQSPTLRQYPDSRHPDPGRFHPVMWWPDTIKRENFYEDSGLLLIGNGFDECAGIVPTYEMFVAIVKAGSARREFNASCAWRDRELDTIEAEYTKILHDDKECGVEAKELDRVTSSNYGEYDEETFEWAMKRRSEVILRTQANDVQKVKLQEQQNDVYARHGAVETRMRDAEYTLWVLLDELLVKVGVLPGIDDADKNPRVQILSAKEPVDGSSLNWSENNWNDEIPGEWKPAPIVDKGSEVFEALGEEGPESTWNNAWKDYPRNEHLLALQDVLYQTADEAIRVEREFNNVREQYDQELKTYMFHQRGKRGNASVRSYQLEEEFGPIWLEKCRKISAKMQDADRGHAQAECALSDANRHDREVRKRPSKPELGLPGQTEAIEPRSFGKRISSRKRRWIDEWLEDVYMNPGDEDRQKPREEPGQPITVATDEASRSLRSEDVPMATGSRRRRIDRYVLRSRDLRPDTSNTALQQLHLEWAQKVGEWM